MAKRKKRKSSSKGGGAFGKAKTRSRDEVIVPFSSGLGDGGSFAAEPGFSPEQLRQGAREKDEFMAMVSREMAKQNISSPEQAQEFMNANFVGRPMAEMLAEYGRFDDSAYGRSLEILDGIKPGCSAAKVRSTALRALKEDPDCVNAFMFLAQIQPTLKKEIQFNRKAVAAGRRKFSDLIESIDPQGGHGLWGHHEARPFLCAMQEMAGNLQANGDEAAAIVVFEEILAINPGDNQGIRDQLVVAYLREDGWDRAQAIFDRFPDDEGCQFLYAKLFLELGRAFAEAPVEFDFENGRDPFDALPEKALVGARKALKQAVEQYPWAVALLTDMRLSMVEPLGSYRYGSPSEALGCARLSVSVWLGAPMAATWLLVEARKIIESKKVIAVLRKYRDDFLDLCAEIEELPNLDEIELFANADVSSDERALFEAMETFCETSEDVRDVLVKLAEL